MDTDSLVLVPCQKYDSDWLRNLELRLGDQVVTEEHFGNLVFLPDSEGGEPLNDGCSLSAAAIQMTTGVASAVSLGFLCDLTSSQGFFLFQAFGEKAGGVSMENSELVCADEAKLGQIVIEEITRMKTIASRVGISQEKIAARVQAIEAYFSI